MTWTSDYGAQRACPKGVHVLGWKGLKPIYYSILYTLLIFMNNATWQLLNLDCSEDLLLSHQKCYLSKCVRIILPWMSHTWIMQPLTQVSFWNGQSIYTSPEHLSVLMYILWLGEHWWRKLIKVQIIKYQFIGLEPVLIWSLRTRNV